jgi:hypothetical protein
MKGNIQMTENSTVGQSENEIRLTKMGRQALDKGLVRVVGTSNEYGTITKDARLLVVTADTPDSALDSIETRAAILLPDGFMSQWNLLLGYPRWGDWYPIKGSALAAQEKKSAKPTRCRGKR